MPLHRDEGVVLRTRNLGEADRIITFLTRDRGRVRAVAKGVRRTSSKFGSRLEPFTFVDVQIFEKHGRELHLVTQAETLAAYGGDLVLDYPRYTAGQAMLETAERLSEDDVPAVQQYLLLVGGLRTLAAGEHAAGLVLDAFLLRSLSVAGYAPSFVDCARCGDEGPHRFFNLPAGGVVCGNCRAVRVAPRPRGRRSPCWAPSCPGTGATRTRARRSTAGRQAAWSRPTCSGTWNADCDR